MMSWPRSFNIREGVQRPLLAVLRIEQASKPELLALFSTRLCPGNDVAFKVAVVNVFASAPPPIPSLFCVLCALELGL